MSTSPYELRWGILSTGNIAGTFARDLLVDPATRGVRDVKHRIVAVGSRSKASAERFIDEQLKASYSIQSFGSYDELYKARDVQCIYVATPHSHHYENVKAALEHGKHVCLEKPATVNAKQWRALCEIARANKVFLMEAVWTRFFPLVYHYQSLISGGVIGDVQHIFADLSFQRPIYDASASVLERFVSPALAGGALLDMGPYPLVHILMAVPHPYGLHPPQEGPLPLPHITSSMIKSQEGATRPFGGGEIDESTFATILFPAPGGKQIAAQLATSLVYNTPKERSVVIVGTKGQITIPFPPFRPQKLVVKACTTERDWADGETLSVDETQDFPLPGGMQGMSYEADECARCIRDGKLESDRITWRETAFTMDVFDEIRRQNSLRYPTDIEAVF